jgi:hypothetical protein
MDCRCQTSKLVLARCMCLHFKRKSRSLTTSQWHHSSYKAFCSNYGEHSTGKMGYHCWNEEAIESMKGDMSAVWDSFAVDLEAHLERINGVVQAFGNALSVALSTGANEPDAANNTRSAMRTLAATLRHRKELTLYGIEKASESFHSELSSLHTDTFSSIRTAFIGKLMENTYHAANMEYGKPALLLPALSHLLLTPIPRFRQRPPPQEPHHRQIRLPVPLQRPPA